MFNLFKRKSKHTLPVSKVTGKPVIHFAHANGMPSGAYQPMFKALEEKYTVVFIPVLGADESKYPVDNHWEQLIQQIIDSVKTTCAEHQVKSVIGLGHSLGALCTLRAIYRHPKLFSQAVLLDPPLIGGYRSFIWHLAKIGHKVGFSQAVDKMSPAGVSQRRRDVWDSPEQAYEGLRHKSLFKHFDERCFQGYIEHGLTQRQDGKYELTFPKSREVAVFRNNPSWYWLTPNRPPAVAVRFIIGTDSLFLTYKFPQKVKKRLGIAYDTHKGGHMFPLEYPESVAQKIMDIIAAQT